MHVSIPDIKGILAPIYYDACLDADVDMQVFVPHAEEIKNSILASDSLGCWDRLRLDNSRFGKSPYLLLFNRFKKDFYAVVTKNTIAFVEEVNTSNTANIFPVWMNEVAEALLNWNNLLFDALLKLNLSFNNEQVSVLEKLKLASVYIIDNKWSEAYTAFFYLANEKLLTAKQRGYFEVYCGQIRLYWFSKQECTLDHFTKAKELYPENYRAERALGEYYIKNAEYEKARSYLLSAVSMEPNDAENYLYVGDTYKLEDKMEIALKWYNDGLQVNFLSSNVYSRFVEAYCEDVFEEKQEVLVAKTISTAKKLFDNDPSSNELYNLLRDAGSSLSKNLHYDVSKKYYEEAIALKPELSAAKLDLAYIYGYEKNFEEAEKYFNLSVRKDIPGYEFDVYWGLGWLYEQWEKPAQAIAYYEKCVNLTTELKDRVFNILGILYFNQKEYNNAVTWYSKAIDDNPFEKIYYDNLRRTYEDMKDAASLPELYEKAVANLKTDATYANYLAVYHHDRNEHNEAVEYYNKAIERDNNSALYYTNRGLAHEVLKDYDKAESDYRQAYHIESSADTANRIGAVLYLKQEYDKAVDLFKEAIGKNDQNPLFYTNLASSYEKLEQADLAEEFLLKALALSDDAVHQNKLGLFYYNTKKSEKAIPYYTKAIELDPANTIYPENLMLAYVDTGRYTEAEQLLEVLYAKDRSNVTMLDYLLLCKVKLSKYSQGLQLLESALVPVAEKITMLQGFGRLQEDKQEIDEAIITYKAALQLDSNSEYFNNRIGIMLYRLGGEDNFAAAAKHYQKAIDASPTTGIYYENLSLAYQHLGQVELAEQASLKGAELDPGNADLQNNVGVFYADYLQDFRQAITYYNKAIAINPNVPVYYTNLASAFTSLGDEDAAKNMTEKAEQLQV